MLSNLANPFDVLLIIGGIIFLLKKLTEMDRYFGLRVVVFTAILSCGVISSVCSIAGDLFPYSDCVIEFNRPEDQF